MEAGAFERIGGDSVKDDANEACTVFLGLICSVMASTGCLHNRACNNCNGPLAVVLAVLAGSEVAPTTSDSCRTQKIVLVPVLLDQPQPKSLIRTTPCVVLATSC